MNTRIQAAVDEIDGQIARLTECRRSLTALFGEGEGTAPAALVQTSGPVDEKLKGVVRRYQKRQKARDKVVKRGPYRKRAKATEGTKGTNGTEKTNDLRPMSADLIAVARKLAEPFKAGHLQGAIGCPMKVAQNALVRWKIKGWVENAGLGEYRRSKTFGEEGAALPAKPAEPVKDGDGRRPTLQVAPAAPAATEEKLTPYSVKGIAIGKSLKKEFTVDELGALLPLGKQAAYYWIGQWRNRNWIEKRDYDVYRKTEEFGTGGGGG